MSGKIDRDIKRVTKRFKRKHVAVGIEAASYGFEASWLARLHAKAKGFGVSSFEDAEC